MNEYPLAKVQSRFTFNAKASGASGSFIQLVNNPQIGDGTFLYASFSSPRYSPFEYLGITSC